jgi:hypothetical protein
MRPSFPRWCAVLAVFGTGPLVGCMSISGMEVVQAVQTPGNTVPMVALKPTFVRVYVRSVELSHGPWQVDARLTVKDAAAGTQHELAPIHPTPIAVSPAGGDRGRWANSITFLLDRVDTYPGDRILEVRVFEVGGGSPPRTETLTQVWTFHPPVYDSSYGVVWSVTNDDDQSHAPLGPAAPWSDFAAHVAYAQNTFPVTGYSIVPLPGVGRAPPNPQTFHNLIESRVWASEMLAKLPPGSKINLLDNWDTGGLHGYAWGMASEEQNARDTRVGATMAQEVSHNNGLWCHTFDGCTAQPNYPRKSGLIDPADIGFNVSGNAGRPDVLLVSRLGQRNMTDAMPITGPTGDYMSYVAPAWTSSFTYCMLIQQLWSPGRAPCSYADSIEREDAVTGPVPWRARTVPAPQRAKPAPPPRGAGLFVAGYVGTNGAGRFMLAEPLPQSTVTLIAHEHGDLDIEVVDESGAAVGRVHVAADSEHPQPTVPFSAFVPASLLTPRAARLRLKRGNTTIADRPLSRHAPAVQIRPLEDKQPAGAQTLRWSAKSPDGEPLRYSVLYSPDDGARWWPLNVGVTDTSVRVDTAALPGSDRARFRVRAANFGQAAESAPIGPYRIAAKPPVVTIDAPANGSAFTTGDVVLARSSAFSWQEGVLTDSTRFAWALDGRPIGDGDWVVLRALAAGDHTLSVSVRDAVGLMTQTSIRFTARPSGQVEMRNAPRARTPAVR